MLFNSFDFLCFFPLVCIVYFIIPELRIRNIFLLCASYYFYMCWEPVYALLLLSSTGITYISSLLINRFQSRRKVFLSISIAVNLSILFFFKYFNFAADIIHSAAASLGLCIDIPDFNLLLPVGISFYIFQALGYTIDVYRGNVEVERNFLTYALFVSFFPQLVAGPIERSTNLLQQFNEKKRFDGKRAIEGTTLMLLGYFLKLVIADRCALSVDYVWDNLETRTSIHCIIAAILFSFQIYGDFAGYSMIAIGCAKVMGFSLMDNFKRPYLSTSIQEFWRRWHISLTTWFRDYIYFPLGGNRVSKVRWIINTMIVFLVSGVWHGANYTFILWGGVHGLCMVIERLLYGKQIKHLNNLLSIPNIIRTALTFCVVTLAWVLFRASTLPDAIDFFHKIFIFDFSGFDDKRNILKCFVSIMILISIETIAEYGKNGTDNNPKHFYSAQILKGIFFLSVILLFGVFDGGQFIYFQF